MFVIQFATDVTLKVLPKAAWEFGPSTFLLELAAVVESVSTGAVALDCFT